MLRFCYFQSITSSLYGLLLILLAVVGNAGVALSGPSPPKVAGARLMDVRAFERWVKQLLMKHD